MAKYKKRIREKECPVEHEEKYILYLEKQIDYFKRLNILPNKIGDYTKQIEEFKFKLSKARLKLKILKTK